MPDKNNRACKTAGIISAFLITFNLVFQGLAFSLHLHSHHHEQGLFDVSHLCNMCITDTHAPCMLHGHNLHKDDFSLEEAGPFKAGSHDKCLICKILKTLHHPFASASQRFVVFTPFYFQKTTHKFDDFNRQCQLKYDPRAPPVIGYHFA
ncbi:MAG: hypothetical protein ABIJ31_10435 [Pseudomonadota bacterium]